MVIYITRRKMDIRIEEDRIDIECDRNYMSIKDMNTDMTADRRERKRKTVYVVKGIFIVYYQSIS